MYLFNNSELSNISGGCEPDLSFKNMSYHVECEINPGMSRRDLTLLAAKTGVPPTIINTIYNECCNRGTPLRLSVDLNYSVHQLTDSDEIYADFIGFPLTA